MGMGILYHPVVLKTYTDQRYRVDLPQNGHGMILARIKKFIVTSMRNF